MVIEYRFRLLAIDLEFTDLLPMEIDKEILNMGQSECDFDVASVIWLVLWHEDTEFIADIFYLEVSSRSFSFHQRDVLLDEGRIFDDGYGH